MRRFTLPILLSLLFAVPALAGMPTSRARVLLTLADSPDDLRARLLAYADSTVAGDPYGAGEAFHYAGLSLQREGRIDSAIACHRRAVVLRGAEEESFALVDQLLLRRAPADVAEVFTRLAPMTESASLDPRLKAAVLGRLAWARFLDSQTDSAASLFDSVELQLRPQSEWRYRMGRVRLAQKHYRQAGDLLLQNAVLSRGTDDEVIEMLETIGTGLGMTERIRDEVFRQVNERDKVEQALAKALGGSLVRLWASDGFPLVGLALGPTRRARTTPTRLRPLALVLMAPADTLASGDSLAVALRRHGYAVLLLQPRGSGNSVAPACPLHDAWLDRESMMQTRVARDVRDAVRGLARLMPVDTTRYLLAGVGLTAGIAVEAATLDARARALLLVSPAPAPVDRGVTRARLARLRLPVFFQIAPEDFDDCYEITEALYQAGDRGASRVSDATTSGRGLAQFRKDAKVIPRFLNWLDGALPRRAAPAAKAAPRPTPPAPRR